MRYREWKKGEVLYTPDQGVGGFLGNFVYDSRGGITESQIARSLAISDDLIHGQ